MVEPGLAEILVVVEFSLTKACVMTVDLTRKITLHQNLLHMLHILHRVRDFKRRQNLISSMRHARGEKRGVKRDRSVSSSVGSSTTPPSAKARKIKRSIKRKRSKSSGSGVRTISGSVSELGIRATWENLIDPITTELELDIRAAWENLVDPITTELSSLVNKRRITPSQSALALADFRNDVSLGLLWLKMTTPKKLQYICQARYSM